MKKMYALPYQVKYKIRIFPKANCARKMYNALGIFYNAFGIMMPFFRRITVLFYFGRERRI